MFYFIYLFIFESITMCLWLPGKVKAAKQRSWSIKFILRSWCPQTCRSQMGRLSPRRFSPCSPPMPVCVGTLRVSREPRSASAVGSLSATWSAPSCHQSLDFRFYFIFLCVLSPCYGESVCLRTLCSEYQGTSLNVSWVRAVVSHKPPRGWRCTFYKFSLAASLSYAHPSYFESIL